MFNVGDRIRYTSRLSKGAGAWSKMERIGRIVGLIGPAWGYLVVQEGDNFDMPVMAENVIGLADASGSGYGPRCICCSHAADLVIIVDNHAQQRVCSYHFGRWQEYAEGVEVYATRVLDLEAASQYTVDTEYFSQHGIKLFNLEERPQQAVMDF